MPICPHRQHYGETDELLDQRNVDMITNFTINEGAYSERQLPITQYGKE